MDWDIYSIGDAVFLSEVLAASAAIMGRGDYMQLIAVVILIGVVWVFVQGIISGGREIKIQNIAIGVLMYALFFGVTVDRVFVFDIQNRGGPYPVYDVPIGLAFTGTTLSRVGINLTRWFETEFSTPTTSIEGTGVGFGLEVLYRMRDLGFDDGSLNWDPGGRLTKSLEHYLKDCAYPGSIIPTQDAMSSEYTGSPAIELYDVTTSVDAWNAMRWNNSVYHTKVWDQALTPSQADSANVHEMSCVDAHDFISDTYFNDDALVNHWLGIIGRSVCSEAGTGCARYQQSDGSFNDVQFDVDVATIRDQLLGSDVELDRLLYNRVITAAAARVGNSTAVGDGDALFSAVTSRASAQTTTSQALQQSMWERMSRPLMTYFEAMMYIAAPFAAILVASGVGGLSMVGKYLVFALWIQLWAPIMAVANLYLDLAASGSFLATQGFNLTTGTGLESLFQQEEMFDELSHWIGTGSLLVASTPAIALMLMYGSAVTASSLAGRIDSAKDAELGMDSFKGKAQSGERSAIMTDQGNIAQGLEETSNARQGAISTGEMLENGIQATQADISQHQRQATDAQSTATEKLSAVGGSLVNGESYAQTDSNETVSSQEFAQQQTEQLMEGTSLTEGQQRTVEGAFNAKASGGASLGKFTKALENAGVKTGNVSQGHMAMIMSALDGEVGAGAGYQDKFNQAAAETEELSHKVNEQWGQAEKEMESWKTGFQSQEGESFTESEEFKEAEKSSSQYQESESRAETAQQQLQQLQGLKSNAGFQRGFQVASMMGDMEGNEGAMAGFRNHVAAMQDQEGGDYYDGMDAENATSGDYARALKGALQSGNLSDLGDLMGMSGRDLDTHLDAPGEEQVGIANLDRGMPEVGNTGARNDLGRASTNEEISNLRAGAETLDNDIEQSPMDVPREGGALEEEFNDRAAGFRDDGMGLEEGAGHAIQSAGGDFMNSLSTMAGAISGGNTGATLGGGAGAGLAARARAAAGQGMRGVMTGAARGFGRGGAAGFVAGAVIEGGYAAYQGYQDEKANQMKAETLEDTGGDLTQAEGDQADLVGAALGGVVAQRMEAQMEAENNGEEFDEQAFQSGLGEFDQAVYNQADSLMDAGFGQNSADSIAGAVADKVESYEQGRIAELEPMANQFTAPTLANGGEGQSLDGFVNSMEGNNLYQEGDQRVFSNHVDQTAGELREQAQGYSSPEAFKQNNDLSQFEEKVFDERVAGGMGRGDGDTPSGAAPTGGGGAAPVQDGGQPQSSGGEAAAAPTGGGGAAPVQDGGQPQSSGGGEAAPSSSPSPLSDSESREVINAHREERFSNYVSQEEAELAPEWFAGLDPQDAGVGMATSSSPTQAYRMAQAEANHDSLMASDGVAYEDGKILSRGTVSGAPDRTEVVETPDGRYVGFSKRDL